MAVPENMSQKKLTIRFTAKNLRVVSKSQAQETASCLKAESDSKPDLVPDVPEGKACRMDQVVDLVKFPSMTVPENMPQKKLTIRFTAKNLRVVSKSQAQETAPCLKVESDSKPELEVDVPEGKRRRMDKVVDLVKFPSTTVTEKMSQKKLRVVTERQAQKTAPGLKVKSDLNLKQQGLSKKRKSELVLDVAEGKRRKMDEFVKRHCSIILKELLSHHGARIFSRPVDPVALSIPDYFSIISHPMDLGTIKSKLEDNLYLSGEEFAADVCLTFSNALHYNPPNSLAYQYARELDHYFKRRWKYQLASWNHQNKGVGLVHNTQDSADFSKKLKKSKSNIVSGAKNSIAVEEKQELRKEVMVMLRSLKSSRKLPELLQRFNLKKGNLSPNISALSVSALKELKNALKSFSDSNCAKLLPTTKTKVNGLESLSGKVVVKGGLVNSKQSVSSVSPLCGLCRGSRGVPRQCCHQKSKLPPPASSNEKSLKQVNHATNTKSPDIEGDVLLTHRRSESAHDSDGCIPHMDGESLKKALRVAMLKSRFADTIMKANGDKVDPRKLHQERERLERLQREATKIEAQKREQKMIIEKKREAARIAIEEMERTVVVEDSLKDLRELERLSRCSLENFSHAFGVLIDRQTCQFRTPVELLGLVLKKEDDEVFSNSEREEGEIF